MDAVVLLLLAATLTLGAGAVYASRRMSGHAMRQAVAGLLAAVHFALGGLAGELIPEGGFVRPLTTWLLLAVGTVFLLRAIHLEWEARRRGRSAG